MISYLQGKILSLTHETAIIVCGGVGYEVILSSSAQMKLSGKSEGEVYTYLQVREDGVSLYGFSSLEEKNMFMQLISVSGIGPKGGIAILSQMDINTLVVAIATSDVQLLSSVKGLGKKSAERLVLELKEKMSSTDVTPSSDGASIYAAPLGNEDAIVALMALGFTRAESMSAVEKAKKSGASTVEDIIRAALMSM